MGDHSYTGGEFLPGTELSPKGEPIGPASNTGIADTAGAADQDTHYEEVEDLQPDLSLWDAAVVAVR